MEHIRDVRECFNYCKDRNDIEKVIKMIPNCFGSFEVEYGEDKESDGNLGLFVTPKIGLRLFTWDEIDWGIQAGYRWDFQEFKFSKAYTADYFTIGIIGLF